MRVVTSRVSIVVPLLVLAAGLAAAQAPVELQPAPTAPCNGLENTRPALHALCVAFHQADVSDARLLAVYDDLKGPADPAMPGVPEEGCPCYGETELNAIPQPYYQCVVHFQEHHSYWTNILHEYAEGMGGASVTVDEWSPYGSGCIYKKYVDGEAVVTSISHLSQETALACEQSIISMIEQNQDQCLILDLGE